MSRAPTILELVDRYARQWANGRGEEERKLLQAAIMNAESGAHAELERVKAALANSDSLYNIAVVQIDMLRDVAKKNHEWHQNHDEYDGYPESELCELNTAACAGVSYKLVEVARFDWYQGQFKWTEPYDFHIHHNAPLYRKERLT